MTLARSEHPAAVLGNEIVVAGGFIGVGVGRSGVTPTVEAYSPESDTWRDLPDLPEARHHGMAAVVEDRAFFIGGYTASGDASTSVWELVDDVWVDRAPMPEPVAAGAAVVLGQGIHVVGGAPGGLFLRYDPEGDSWSRLREPAREREHVASVVLDDEVWAIAGRWEGEVFATTEVFDTGTETWRAGPSLGEARSGFGAAVIDGAIVVAGGEVFSPDEALTSVEMLEPDDDQWATIEPLPHGLHGNPLVAFDAAVYLPGGSIRAAGVDNDGQTYRLLPR
jgi:N-acetylneuraminic acid mutarotase